MNNLSSLKKLVSKLNSTEVNLLRKQLEDHGTFRIEQKSILLLKLLSVKEELSSSEIQQKIYGRNNYTAFNKLCNRLKYSIFDVLLIDNSIKSSNYSKRNTLLFELRKKIIQADMIQLRGINDEVMQIYNSVIAKSYKNEFYDILIQALNSKLRFVSLFSNKKIIDKLKSEIDDVEVKWLALNQTQRTYQSVINKISLHSDYHMYVEDLEKAIGLLRINYSKSKSTLIKYYLLNLEIEFAQIFKKYTESNSLLLEIEKLVRENESVYTDNRYGTILLNISNNNLLLRKFELAISNAEQSRKYFLDTYLTNKIVDEIIFYSLFYQNKFTESEKYIDLDNKLKRNESTEIIFSKFNFYQACVAFKKGNYTRCISLLNNYKEIEKDKEGWNIAKRILVILSRIELEEQDSLDLSLGSMSKFLKRLSKSNYINPRFELVLKICMLIVRENIDWKRIGKKKKQLFKYLELFQNENMQWQIKSPELINFEDWIRSKLKLLDG